MSIEKIIRDRDDLIKEITSDLHVLVGDWGLVVESVEIRDVEVIDKELKTNLEAQKKLAEAERAQVREAQKNEIVQMRQLTVQRETG